MTSYHQHPSKAMAYMPFISFPKSPDETGRSQEKLPGTGYVAYVSVFLASIIICRLYKLTFSNQTNVTLQKRVSLSN